MSDDRRPTGYHDQDGCHNCRNVCAQDDYDDPTLFYCEHGAPPRPLHGGLDERFPAPVSSTSEWETALEAWREWRTGREVFAYGMCPRWEYQEVDDAVHPVSD